MTIKPQWKTSKLNVKFGLSPKEVRTPRCHRVHHKKPAEIRSCMQAFPKMWRHGDKKESWKKVKYSVDREAGTNPESMPDHLRAQSKQLFEKWLSDRCMTNLRVIENVTKNHGDLQRAVIIPGFTWGDFDNAPEYPKSISSDKWDLYLTDFATDTYAPLKAYLDDKYTMENGELKLPVGIWLRYHGLNLYALSSILATNHAIPSAAGVAAGLETACGRGVYTSRQWHKASQYAIPHLMEGSKVLTKAIALFVIPGASGHGGAATWAKKKASVSGDVDGQWTKRPNWLLVPEDAVEDQFWEKPDSDDVIPYPMLQARTTQKRQEGRGEIPWTNQDDSTSASEEQNSVVHLAGFLVTRCTAQAARHMTCGSRDSDHFVGWEERLEPPIGRPIAGWDDIEARPGRPSADESRATSEASKRDSVWDTGSSVGSSPRTEPKQPRRTPNQGCTFQDDEFGSLKKLPEEPYWIVFRKEVAEKWRLLCGKPPGQITLQARNTRRGRPVLTAGWTTTAMGSCGRKAQEHHRPHAAHRPHQSHGQCPKHRRSQKHQQVCRGRYLSER